MECNRVKFKFHPDAIEVVVSTLRGLLAGLLLYQSRGVFASSVR